MCLVPEFYDEHQVTARRPHRCCDTGRRIRRGERHWVCAGKWEGDFQRHRQCESGYHLCRSVNHDLFGDCVVPFGALRDELRDTFFEDSAAVVMLLIEGICDGTLAFSEEDDIRLVLRAAEGSHARAEQDWSDAWGEWCIEQGAKSMRRAA